MKLALSALLVLTACSLTPRPPPALHDFGPSLSTGSNKGSVTVKAPSWLQDTRLRYRMLFNDPTQIRFYANHRWLAPPPALLKQQLSALLDTPYTLHIQLRDLEQVFDTPTSSRVVLRFLAQAATADGQILGTEVFAFETPTVSADVQGALLGYAALVAHAANKVQAWLTTLSSASIMR